jgi:AbrB family looped-hinge helix DNA binding protein
VVGDGKTELTLKVDDRGRVTLPKEVREQSGSEPNDEIPATLIGSVLKVTPQPNSRCGFYLLGRRKETPTPRSGILPRLRFQ